MTEHQCACGQPAPTTTICGSCTDRLARDLGDVPAYATELETVLTRQTRYGDRGDGSRSTTRALPFDLRASEASWVLRNTLVGWVRVLDGDGEQWPAGDLDAMSRWLLRRVDRLARHDAGDQAVDEIGSAVALARRVIDRPADRVYAGICSAPLGDGQEATTGTVCDADIYALPGRQYVTCPACGASWDVTDRRALMLEQLEDVLLSAREMAVALPGLGVRAIDSTIRSWAHRSRLEAKGVNVAGDPICRCGDILDLYAAADKIKEKAS